MIHKLILHISEILLNDIKSILNLKLAIDSILEYLSTLMIMIIANRKFLLGYPHGSLPIEVFVVDQVD